MKKYKITNKTVSRCGLTNEKYFKETTNMNNLNTNLETLSTMMSIRNAIQNIASLKISTIQLSVLMKNCLLDTNLKKLEKMYEDFSKPDPTDRIAEELYYTVFTALYDTANYLFTAHMMFGVTTQKRKALINKFRKFGFSFNEALNIETVAMHYNLNLEESGEDYELMVIPDLFIDESLDGHIDDKYYMFVSTLAKRLISEFPDRRFMLPKHTAMRI